MAAEIADFLKAAQSFSMTTVDTEGNPRNRLFSTVVEYEGHLLIGTGASKQVLEELTKNGSVAITTVNKKTTETVRIDGRAVACGDEEARVKFWQKNPMASNWFSGPDDPKFKLFSVVGEATIVRKSGEETHETKIKLT
jgi:uncharacterized pyridoxamine 5'-phosphate oxidase family protein